VEFTGSLPAGYEIINLKVEPSNVILEEKESSISQISKVVAFVNLDEADDNKELVIRGSVLDDNDQLLRQFEGKVPVIVTFNLAKKVPVAVATTGKPANDFYLKNIRYSMNELRIIGSRSVLEGIKSVSAEAIDITDKSESFTIPLVINPPKGVTVYKEDSDRLSAEVILEKSITRTFNISPGMVSIYGGDTSGAVEYRITDTIIPITVKGKVDDINAVKTADIRLSIRVNDLEPGQHEVPLIVSVPNTVNLIGEYSVNVMITTTPVTEPTPGL
jgi:YbbR domain-containing protein